MAASSGRVSIWGWMALLASILAIAGLFQRQVATDNGTYFHAELKEFYSSAARYLASENGQKSAYPHIPMRTYPQINEMCLPYWDTDEGKTQMRTVADAYSEYESSSLVMIVCFGLASLGFLIPVLRLTIMIIVRVTTRSTKSIAQATNRAVDKAYEVHALKQKKASQKIQSESDDLIV